MANLVRNYHPHIQPSVEEATPTAELRRVLNMTARDMLASFLKKSRDNVASLVVDPLDVAKVQKVSLLNPTIPAAHSELRHPRSWILPCLRYTSKRIKRHK